VCDRADVGPVGVPVAGDATTTGELSDAALPRAGGGLQLAEKQNPADLDVVLTAWSSLCISEVWPLLDSSI
jgi:hypothetical protein